MRDGKCDAQYVVFRRLSLGRGLRIAPIVHLRVAVSPLAKMPLDAELGIFEQIFINRVLAHDGHEPVTLVAGQWIPLERNLHARSGLDADDQMHGRFVFRIPSELHGSRFVIAACPQLVRIPREPLIERDAVVIVAGPQIELVEHGGHRIERHSLDLDRADASTRPGLNRVHQRAARGSRVPGRGARKSTALGYPRSRYVCFRISDVWRGAGEGRCGSVALRDNPAKIALGDAKRSFESDAADPEGRHQIVNKDHAVAPQRCVHLHVLVDARGRRDAPCFRARRRSPAALRHAFR